MTAIARVAAAFGMDITKLEQSVDERIAELQYEAELEPEDDDLFEFLTGPGERADAAEVDELFQSLH